VKAEMKMNPAPYEPKPIDTSKVRLPREVEEIAEQLARNNHEVWARERRQQGWQHGPERNDERKEHPGLVPYDELSEDEKEVDRATVEQTLKAAVALGCKIKVVSPEVSGQAESGSFADDMEVWPDLPAGFESPKENLLRIYRHSDHEAKRRLRLHRPIVWIAALCGSFAVGAAIWELFQHQESTLDVRIEFAFASLALLAVVSGASLHLMRQWLMERHRAERCRFAKYQILLQLAAAGGDREVVQRCLEDFTQQTGAIAGLDRDDLEQFIEEDPVPEAPPEVQRGSGKSLYELTDHYVKQRLSNQAKYFLTQSRKKNAIDGPLRVLPPLFFFASIFCAFVHFAPSVGGLDKVFGAIHPYSPWWIFFAAVLPVAGAGIRLLRSAFEYSRNTARFRAKYRALEQLMAKLQSELDPRKTIAPAEVVCDMWRGELILEQEHREWLRLMKEAEWFG